VIVLPGGVTGGETVSARLDIDSGRPGSSSGAGHHDVKSPEVIVAQTSGRIIVVKSVPSLSGLG